MRTMNLAFPLRRMTPRVPGGTWSDEPTSLEAPQVTALMDKINL
jgi:hypothetical protein